jgi:competence ComEA-like helix-hairpin-helix protein
MKNRIYCRFFFYQAVVGLLLGPLTVPAAAATKAKKIDLNTATLAKLEALKGVGPSLAQKIVAARPFKSVDDLKNVSGIGQAKFDDLKDLVTVKAVKTGKKSETKAKATAKSTSPAAKQSTSAGPVDLNSADKAALEALPGIGPELAEKIIVARPFKSVEDIQNVSGIGKARFDDIKNLVTIEADDETAVSPKLKPGQTININKASEEQLDALLGIGPVKAEAIIAGRPYAKIADIMKVKGIKEKTFAKIKDYIVVR